MLDTRSLQYIDPFCPQGGSWFACPSGSRFLGCCTSNPCQNGCLDGNLKPASFNGTDIGQFADQECVAGQFYTCEKTNPPFLGCCKSNPCQAGQCPQTDLTAAFLSNDPAEAADFLPNAASATAVTLSVTEGSSITVATAALAPTSSSPSAHTRVSNGAIIGIALGGFVFCVCLLAISMFLFARRSRVRQPSVNEKKQNAAEIPNDYFLNASSPGGGNRDSFSPTSLYSSNGTWRSPASLGIPHDPQDSPRWNSPQLDSVEVVELDGACAERNHWKTRGRSTDDLEPSRSECNGVDTRSRPAYIPYRPGARLVGYNMI